MFCRKFVHDMRSVFEDLERCKKQRRSPNYRKDGGFIHSYQLKDVVGEAEGINTSDLKGLGLYWKLDVHTGIREKQAGISV